MGLATLGIGILPDHAQIGTAAALLLVLLRILQGLSVGGEFTDLVVMLAEQAPLDRRGFVASWAEMGGIVGMLLGSGVGALTSSLLGDAAMHARIEIKSRGRESKLMLRTLPRLIRLPDRSNFIIFTRTTANSIEIRLIEND
jgi:MFS family permease